MHSIKHFLGKSRYELHIRIGINDLMSSLVFFWGGPSILDTAQDVVSAEIMFHWQQPNYCHPFLPGLHTSPAAS